MATITETRKIQGIDEVSLLGYGELVVEQDAGAGETASLVIEADDSLLPKIASDVRGRRLLLGLHMPWYEWITWVFSWAFTVDKAVRYHLKVSRIQDLAITGSGRIRCDALHADSCGLRITGSGRIDMEGLDAGLVEIHISGSGDVRCAGTSDRIRARITGSGNVEARKLGGRSVDVRISGSGSAAVQAAETLDVHISGSGGVRYGGSPHVSSHITGSGSVRAAS